MKDGDDIEEFNKERAERWRKQRELKSDEELDREWDENAEARRLHQEGLDDLRDKHELIRLEMNANHREKFYELEQAKIAYENRHGSNDVVDRDFAKKTQELIDTFNLEHEERENNRAEAIASYGNIEEREEQEKADSPDKTESWEEMNQRQQDEKSKEMSQAMSDWADMNRNGDVTPEQMKEFSDSRMKSIDDMMKNHLSEAKNQPSFQEHIDWDRAAQFDEQSMRYDIEEMTQPEIKEQEKEDRQKDDELDEMERSLEKARQMFDNRDEITR